MAEELRYDWAKVDCPTCKAPVQQRCRTLTTNWPTDAHERRHQMASLAAFRARLAAQGNPAVVVTGAQENQK